MLCSKTTREAPKHLLWVKCDNIVGVRVDRKVVGGWMEGYLHLVATIRVLGGDANHLVQQTR